MASRLAQRGKQVEPLLALLDTKGHRLALFPAVAFTGVALAADTDGIVRCRLGGLPAALCALTPELHVDLVSLAALWPRWASELVELAGEAAARALFEGELLLEASLSGDRVKELILAHQIRAEHLYLLGQTPAPKAVPAIDRFAPRFEKGTLGIALDRASYERTLAARRLAPDASVRVTWNDAPVALPSAALAWDDEELAELAVLATMQIESGARDEVLRLLETALPDRGAALAQGVALGSILNVWGVALRQKDRLADAIALLTRVHAFAGDVDPQLAQQVAYNLGYAKLQTTMKSRAPLGRRGETDLVHASYDVDPKHRATWTECLALFERALALAPTDATARSQRDQVRTLLALHDTPRGRPPPPAGAQPATPGPAGPDSATWKISLLVAAVFFAAFLDAVLRRERDAPPRSMPSYTQPPPWARPTSTSPPSSGPSSAERARLEALEVIGREPLATTDAPCAIHVAFPEDVPHGAVVAPSLGRAAGTGELYGTEAFDATIRAWATRYAPTIDVHTRGHEAVGPVHDTAGPSSAWTRARYRTTLLATGWQDPIVGGGSIVPGHVEGQLVIWSTEEGRFACAAPVEATNDPHLVVARSADLAGEADDPLNRARLDLVDRGVRAGITALRAIAPPGP